MLSQPDLIQIRNYVIRILPDILRQEPEVTATIEGILAQQFPRRDEFTRLLNEMVLLREDTNQRFEELRADTNRRFEELRADTNRRFEEVNRRLEELREDTNRRFEEVNRRLEELRADTNRRFEEVNQRFEEVNRRLEEFREDTNRRFEQVDQRLDKMHRTQLSLKRDVLQLREGQEMLIKRMDGQDKWLKLNFGELRSEKGKRLEDMFAEALRYGLKNPDILADQIQLRQRLYDSEGLVFRPNYVTEVDLITENHRRTVFEVKATAGVDELYLFSMKVKLMALQHPDRPVHGVFICLGADETVQQQGAEYGLEVIG